jgi:hypothetical protein
LPDEVVLFSNPNSLFWNEILIPNDKTAEIQTTLLQPIDVLHDAANYDLRQYPDPPLEMDMYMVPESAPVSPVIHKPSRPYWNKCNTYASSFQALVTTVIGDIGLLNSTPTSAAISASTRIHAVQMNAKQVGTLHYIVW